MKHTCQNTAQRFTIRSMSSTARARQLRKTSTWAEKRLWTLLRSRRLAGYKFRRQHPVGRYYLDTYCIEAKVAVELDGFQHGTPEHKAHDAARDAYLAAQGIAVKRVWNHQMARRTDRENLVENLWRLLQDRTPHPDNIAPPPYRRAPDRKRPPE